MYNYLLQHQLLIPNTLFFSTALNVSCTIGAQAGRQTYFCTSNNVLVSVECSFDGGEAENCSFPLELTIDRFGTDSHTVVVAVVDEFGQSLDLTFNFTLTPLPPPRECT